MALRILLVGLVASLGCDPPSGGQVTRWMCSAQAWFDSGPPAPAEVAKVEPAAVPMIAIEPGPTYIPIFASEPIPTPAVVEVAQTEPTPMVIADEGFAAIVNKMVVGYLAQQEAPATDVLLVDQVAKPAQPAAWVEMPATEVKPEVEVAANPPTEPSDWVGMPPTEPAPAAVAVAPESPRVEKLGSAVRLTGQALQAWMSLLVQ